MNAAEHDGETVRIDSEFAAKRVTVVVGNRDRLRIELQISTDDDAILGKELRESSRHFIRLHRSERDGREHALRIR